MLAPGVAEAVGVDPHTFEEVLRRINDPGFERWQEQVRRSGGCRHPIRLQGTVTHDGQVVYDTATEPEGVLLKRCGTRRAALCPSCAFEYAGDTWQLLYAGIAGGRKGVPATVGTHPMVFLTLTAPSFGAVHGTRDGKLCRPGGEGKLCRHGRPTCCMRRHHHDDEALGQPLCPHCYDYEAAVLFNWHAPELWRRFTIELRRRLADELGVRRCQLNDWARLEYAKVAEFQRRGAVHFHALIRLDGPQDQGPPPDDLDAKRFAALVTGTAQSRRLVVETPTGPLVLRFGTQIDVRSLRSDGTEMIVPETVAAYLAKYTTKATEDLGVGTRPISAAGARHLGVNPHVVRLVETCEHLATTAPGLRAVTGWTHMLGFRGHFSTKSRHYSTTLGALRAARAQHARRLEREARGLPPDDDDTTLVVGTWTYAGRGYHTNGDALLAASIEAWTREGRRLAREDR